MGVPTDGRARGIGWERLTRSGIWGTPQREAIVIIVTGTKRSGTSMWMQILKAAGIPLIGEAFPKNWEETIQEANPHGFYESPLRRGIFYGTNPDPRTGKYLPPDATSSVAVKVFIPGLCRTDLAFVRQVVGTMRHWREYAGSLERLQEMEHEALEKQGKRQHGPPARLDPVLEWWLENFALVRDLVTRKYPAHIITYEQVLEAPDASLRPVLQWLGAPDVDAGIAAVSPDTKTQDRERIERDHECAEMFDELYATINERRQITNDFLQRVNETHQKLIPVIEADHRRVLEQASQRRRTIMMRNKDPLHPDSLEALIHGADD